MCRRTATLAAFTLILISLVASSCSFLQQMQPATYDPNKTYAAFLVVDSDAGKASLQSMKQHTLSQNLEIGPIEYYNPGTTDFVPVLTRLTAHPEVKLVWIISLVLDVPQIKAAMVKVNYAGSYRYAPIMNGAAIKIQQ